MIAVCRGTVESGIITLTKQPRQVVGAAPQGDGAPDQIVTTYPVLADAIRSAIDELFADPFVYGPRLRETGVDRLVGGIIDRVSPSAKSPPQPKTKKKKSPKKKKKKSD